MQLQVQRRDVILKYYSTQAINYARWQLLRGELAVASASLDNGWDIIRKIKYPSTTASEATRLACVQAVESAMPFAIARPFVEEFIDNETISKVNNFRLTFILQLYMAPYMAIS